MHLAVKASLFVTDFVISSSVVVAWLINAAKSIEQDLELFPLAPRDSLALGLEVVVKGFRIGKGSPALFAKASSRVTVFIVGNIERGNGLPGVVYIKVVRRSAQVATIMIYIVS